MNSPFLDLGRQLDPLLPDLEAALRRVLTSGRFILGPEVEAFETEWARYVGAKHCVSVGNGLDALSLALRATGVGAGAEVIVPANTYIASWLAISHAGARPVPVEPDENTMVVQAGAMAAAVTTRTRAIMPVHLYGRPAQMLAFESLAQQQGLAVIDDAAQAHGAISQGSKIGSLGHCTAWSFYPTKNLGALGDGGAITTNDEHVASVVKRLRNYGSEHRYVNSAIGYNSRLDEVQAAVLRVRLRSLDDDNMRRRRLAKVYSDVLDPNLVSVPPLAAADDVHVWHQYVIKHPARDELRQRLSARGVETDVHYPTPPHHQPAYEADFRGESWPVSEKLHREVLSLPMGTYLSEVVVERIAEAVNDEAAALVDS